MTRPLDGIRVLDFTRVLAGPYCTMILGDLGAEVVKIEQPVSGDDLRGWGPPFMEDGESTYFLSVNRNKRSITLDLKSDAGRELATDLATRSDVMIENFRHGALDRMGLGYEAMSARNPGLVYCSISGFGQTGPLREKPGYDVLLQAFGGLMSVTGEPDGLPTKVGVAMVDVATGLYAAIAVLAALQGRQRTGVGQRLDVSLLDTVLACMPNLTSGFLNGGVVPARQGNHHPNVAPYSVFPTKDGHITLAVGNDAQWRRLCAAVGEPGFADDPRFALNGDRVRAGRELDDIVTHWFASWSTADLVAHLEAHDVPNGPIHGIDEVLDDEHVRATGAVVDVLHASAGPLRFVGNPIRGLTDQSYAAPPLLGEHTAAVVQDVLGLDDAAVDRLRASGAFG